MLFARIYKVSHTPAGETQKKNILEYTVYALEYMHVYRQNKVKLDWKYSNEEKY